MSNEVDLLCFKAIYRAMLVRGLLQGWETFALWSYGRIWENQGTSYCLHEECFRVSREWERVALLATRLEKEFKTTCRGRNGIKWWHSVWRRECLGGHYNHAHVAQRHLRAEDTALTCVGSEGRTQGEFYGNGSWFNQQKSFLTSSAV